MNILYEDAALVVLDKPAGLSSEEGVPAALRQRWNAPNAFVGVVHRLDTGVSGLMVFARTPGAAAALSRQITQSQNAYAVQDGRAEGKPEVPQFIKQYRAVIAGGPDEALPAEGILRDWLFKDSRRGRVFPVSRPRKGVREAVLEYRIVKTAGEMSLAEITLHTGRTHQIRVQFASPEASADRRWQIRQPRKGQHCPAELRPAVPASGHRQAPAVQPAPAGRRTVERVFRMMHRLTAI
ncbi:MAG: RluA family pseudouridine synthase [Faecalibacterium sp.]